MFKNFDYKALVKGLIRIDMAFSKSRSAKESPRLKILIIKIFFVTLVSQGCCLREQRVEPSYPIDVIGWQDQIEQGVRIRGRFVLKQDEAIDNGRIQIKLQKLIPRDPCAHTGEFQNQARAQFQFIRLSDGKVLCESTFGEYGGGSIECSDSANSLGITGIGVRALNLTEGWVFFVVYG